MEMAERYVVAYYYLAAHARYYGLAPALLTLLPAGTTLAELAADAQAEIARALGDPPEGVAVELVPLPAYLARRGIGHRISSHPAPHAAGGRLLDPA